MWSTAIVMGLLAGVDPVRVGAAVYLLSRTRPVRLLIAYFVGGFGMNLIVGAAILFVLRDAGVPERGSAAGRVEIAIGLLMLFVGVLVVFGVPTRLRRRVRMRYRKGRRTDARSPASANGRSELEQALGFRALPSRARIALQDGSVWVAWTIGLAMGGPTHYYLAAIAAMLASDTAVGSQVPVLVVFNLLGFVAAEIPILSFWVAPEATRAGVDQLYEWMKAHRRIAVATLTGVVGIFFVFIGINSL